MFLELIATFAAGAGAAGVVLVLNMVTKGRLPRWVMPVAAGAAMIGVAIANEVSWGSRTIAALPEGVVVVEEIRETAWYRPWSYIVPPTVRIVALDTRSIRVNPGASEVVLVDLYLFARWRPSARIPQLVDCLAGARAGVTEASLADPSNADWRPAGDSLTEQACKEKTDD